MQNVSLRLFRIIVKRKPLTNGGIVHQQLSDRKTKREKQKKKKFKYLLWLQWAENDLIFFHFRLSQPILKAKILCVHPQYFSFSSLFFCFECASHKNCSYGLSVGFDIKQRISFLIRFIFSFLLFYFLFFKRQICSFRFVFTFLTSISCLPFVSCFFFFLLLLWSNKWNGTMYLIFFML